MTYDHNMIYLPDEDSIFLLDTIIDVPARSMLDMGTGTGYVAINYKRAHPDSRVVGADISSEAIELARANAKREGVNIEFVVSDLFSNIDEKYQMIVFNAPYIPDDGMDYDVTVIDRGVVKRFMTDVRNYLLPGGIAFLLVNNLTEIVNDGSWELYRVKHMFFEELRIYKYHQLNF